MRISHDFLIFFFFNIHLFGQKIPDEKLQGLFTRKMFLSNFFGESSHMSFLGKYKLYKIKIEKCVLRRFYGKL